MINIAICDDEKYISDKIRNMAADFFHRKNMETARKLRVRNYKGYLIFVTVLREMVFRSFEVQAYDYLVKPVEDKYFEKTMERLFISMLNASEANLLVQRGYESNIISFDDIIFCEIIMTGLKISKQN